MDERLLDALFSPEQSMINLISEEIPESSINPLPSFYNIEEIKQIEKEAVKLAEREQYTQALEKLNAIISRYPLYPSAYNNRGQIYRLLKQSAKSLQDLNRAISLGEEFKDYKVLKQAYTQRGFLYQGLDKKDLAQADFEKGASYGNSVAKKVAVKNNPFAALCNAIFTQIFENDLVKPTP